MRDGNKFVCVSFPVVSCRQEEDGNRKTLIVVCCVMIEIIKGREGHNEAKRKNRKHTKCITNKIVFMLPYGGLTKKLKTLTSLVY